MIFIYRGKNNIERLPDDKKIFEPIIFSDKLRISLTSNK